MVQLKPKYSLIADHLMREISDGLHPVGELLPTEAELMRAFGVSRHTVRFAVQDLKKRGVVASRQGQGSRVVASAPASAFIETIQSIDELITFGQATVRELIGRRVIEADELLAERFGCAVGRRLAEARMLRKTIEPQPRTIALVTIWIDALIEPVIDRFSEFHKSGAEIIADQYGYVAKEVNQTVYADTFSNEEANALGISCGSPALIIERQYRTSPTSEPYMLARSVCRADTIKLASTFVNSN
ncbi:MAG: GntR family transcriptional regulator [Rhizobiaceae bacterium]|nr:GntR family transcriptional regulator [Rhizobiaceae bacterium]